MVFAKYSYDYCLWNSNVWFNGNVARKNSKSLKSLARRIFFETSCFSEETFDPNGRELVSCSTQELFLEMYNNVDSRMFGVMMAPGLKTLSSCEHPISFCSPVEG